VLQGLYFDTKGCLRRDLSQNISFRRPHGFICFGGYKQSDVRFFVPLKRVAKEHEGKVMAKKLEWVYCDGV
jgi:hypothetical protein